jgi:hypothetical protein
MIKFKLIYWYRRIFRRNKTIDTLATESQKEFKELHERFMVDGVCQCPLCKVLKRGKNEVS